MCGYALPDEARHGTGGKCDNSDRQQDLHVLSSSFVSLLFCPGATFLFITSVRAIDHYGQEVAQDNTERHDIAKAIVFDTSTAAVAGALCHSVCGIYY